MPSDREHILAVANYHHKSFEQRWQRASLQWDEEVLRFVLHLSALTPGWDIELAQQLQLNLFPSLPWYTTFELCSTYLFFKDGGTASTYYQVDEPSDYRRLLKKLIETEGKDALTLVGRFLEFYIKQAPFDKTDSSECRVRRWLVWLKNGLLNPEMTFEKVCKGLQTTEKEPDEECFDAEGRFIELKLKPLDLSDYLSLADWLSPIFELSGLRIPDDILKPVYLKYWGDSGEARFDEYLWGLEGYQQSHSCLTINSKF